MKFRKKPSELTLQDLKKARNAILAIIIVLVVAWIFILGFMYANGKNFSVFIAVAIATMIPSFISLMNFTNEIKKREQNS